MAGIPPTAVGVDYITATDRVDNPHSPLWRTAQDVIEAEQEHGDRAIGWTWKGYVGLATKRATIGARDDGHIVRISSALADDWFTRVVNVARNITRLDLQVTVPIRENHDNVGIEAYRRATSAAERSGKGLRTTIIRGNDGGCTVYIGSRSSVRMGRIYDKFVESGSEGIYRDCWRFELELKQAPAVMLAQHLFAAERRYRVISGQVYAWMSAHGVDCQWDVDAPADMSRVPARKTDDERSVEWFRATVLPVVRRLALSDRWRPEIERMFRRSINTTVRSNGPDAEDAS